MEINENVYIFHDVDEWITYTSALKTKLTSPGGFSRLAGVSRSTVNSWIYRDKLITYYKCKHVTGGEYGVIPVKDLEKVKDRIRR